ncbi:3-methylornithine--L-lysine ligase PylC [Deltaproteobacteria bacterium OttesenSCG-928-M10]|nr:3-methylornithine--L-lysine ligase PylC [Deltaproteobacteria bacterium OttesenSCG-928-M10]
MTFRVGFLGGGLQGTEAACLARWAGWRSVLADRRPAPPASGLADQFIHLDIASFQDLDLAFESCDLIIPACENRAALGLLTAWGQKTGRPVAFDPEAYRISSDKLLSNRLFRDIGIPAPRPWPEADFPLIAKPAAASGSQGVTLLESRRDFDRLFPHGDTAGWVVEEYCPGPSFSLEVTGRPGRHQAWTTTALEMDEVHDCREVRAPADLPPEKEAEFREISLAIAGALSLRGLMDVEIIAAPQGLRVLEIDARLPSQTPTAVYWSTGENLLVRLAENFIEAPPQEVPWTGSRAVIYEHVAVSPDGVKAAGEHIMASAGPLTLRGDFFGADLALTNYQPEAGSWAATLIMMDENPDALTARRREIWTRLQSAAGP